MNTDSTNLENEWILNLKIEMKNKKQKCVFKIYEEKYSHRTFFTIKFSKNHIYSKGFGTVAIFGGEFNFEYANFPGRLYKVIDWG